ncbi:hypothetical protein COE76_22895 [Bacillus pseudomycoides]|nr:hypothetical protein COE76_22895 [Bacillus pseudomycoides]
MPLFLGSKIPSQTLTKAKKLSNQLPVKARLVRANNQWRIKHPLIKISLYNYTPLGRYPAARSALRNSR